MANHASAKKRIRRNARMEIINKIRKNRVRSFIKKVEAAVGIGDADGAKSALKLAQPEIMRGVSKGVMHKKTASRKISRLAASVKKLSVSAA